MNNTRKLSLNILGAFTLGLLSQGCDSSGEDNKANTSQNTTARSVNIKHRAKAPAACAASVQTCVDNYGACALKDGKSDKCANELHDCVFEALGTDACWPDEADKKKKKKKKKKKGSKKKKKGCDKKKDSKKDKKDEKKDDCDKDFEDTDGDFEDTDGDFEDSDGDFEDDEGNSDKGEDDFELGDEDDIPDFNSCEDMNFFATIAKNLGIALKVAACKQ